MAQRKLLAEIDRTLKKVTEGVEVFDSIYEKMQASTNQTQKEKQEVDLKTQIKKLQRLRDLIKGWIASSDVKDKTLLVENRRIIETRMENFKACEKEMKTKAFSKEGLIQSTKLDPKTQEKYETTHWYQEKLDDLQHQVEAAEAEIENLQGSGKKKNKGSGAQAERAEDLERLNERRKWHINRLELILRLLDNGSLSVETVNGLKEDVEYFVQSNAEEEFDEDEGIYDDLNLDEEEEKFGLANDDNNNNNDSDDSEDISEDLPPRTPLKKHHDDESTTSGSKRDVSPIIKKQSATLPPRKTSIAADTPKPPPNLNFGQQPMSSILKAGLPSQPRPPAMSARYAVVAAAAVTPAQPSPSTQVPPTPIAVSSTASSQPIAPNAPSIPTSSSTGSALMTDQTSAATSSPSLTHPSLTSPLLSSAASIVPPDDSMYSAHDSPALSEAVPSSISGPVATSSPQRVNARTAVIASPVVPHPLATSQQPPIESHPLVPQPTTNGVSSQATIVPPGQEQPPIAAPVQVGVPITPSGPSTFSQAQQKTAPQFPPGVRVSEHTPGVVGAPLQMPPQSIRPPSAAPQQVLAPPQPPQRAAGPNAFPGSLSDLVMSFETVKQKATHRMSNLDQVHKLLEGSYSSMPQPQDTDKPKYYVPRNPFQTPSYYPQQPLALLNTAGIFSQLDVETLFYVFYFHPGTYQQYLAAKELKRQSWRFHVKYLTWFQRHSEPQAITEEYEQGVYVYFDWEGSWCQRKKSDFRFEYRYLSED